MLPVPANSSSISPIPDKTLRLQMPVIDVRPEPKIIAFLEFLRQL
jgi:hypothetical protein